MKNTVLIVGGVAVLGGLAFFLYNRNKQQAALMQQATSSNGASVAPGGTSTPSPSYTAPVPTVKQTMWKDKDGNIFQLTSDKQKWGYVIKVNGQVHKKWNQMETMFLGSDGHVRGVDNNGSAFIWKNNQWNYVIKDDKAKTGQFLIDNGQPNVYASMNGVGLGNAFMLN